MTLRQWGTRFPTFRGNVIASSSKLEILKKNRSPRCREASWISDPWIPGHFFASKRLPSYPALYPRRTEFSGTSPVPTDFHQPHFIKLPAAVISSFDCSQSVSLEPPVPCLHSHLLTSHHDISCPLRHFKAVFCSLQNFPSWTSI
jgi:hypothetical protein